MPFYGEAMHMRNMGMSFFVVCPLRNCECKAPKIGMNCNQILTILFLLDSSRFSGQLSRIYKGIPKKDISMFHAKKDISMLFCIEFLRNNLAHAVWECKENIVRNPTQIFRIRHLRDFRFGNPEMGSASSAPVNSLALASSHPWGMFIVS